MKLMDLAGAFSDLSESVASLCCLRHYCAGCCQPERWRHCVNTDGWREWPIVSDSRQGKLELVRWTPTNTHKAFPPHVGAAVNSSIYATLLPPAAPGDQTVPAKSADHQLKSGKFKGVFRQTGYEHQSSYKDPHAIASTLYSIVRIAQQAKWKC